MGVSTDTLRKGAGLLRSGRTRSAVPAMGYDVFRQPLKTKAARITESNVQLCPGLTLFHDSQTPSLHWGQTAECALTLTCYQFDGGYLSLAAGVDEGFRAQMGRGQCVTATLDIETSRPVTTFMRLNLALEDGRETLFETVVADHGARHARFDLDAVHNPFDGLSDAWLDVIFSEPAMLDITISNLSLTLSRTTQ